MKKLTFDDLCYTISDTHDKHHHFCKLCPKIDSHISMDDDRIKSEIRFVACRRIESWIKHYKHWHPFEYSILTKGESD